MLTTREIVSSKVEAEFADEKVGQMHISWVPRRRALQHPTMAAMAENVLSPSQSCGFSDLLLQEGIQELTAKRSEFKLMGDLVEYLTDTVCFSSASSLGSTVPHSPVPIPSHPFGPLLFLPTPLPMMPTPSQPTPSTQPNLGT